MMKSITYLELLQMIKESKQPKTIITKVDGDNHKYTYGGGSYVDKDGRSLKDDWAFRYYSPYGHATQPFIYYEDEILDNAEKRYLKGVIRPFRDKVKYIEKEEIRATKQEYIRIVFNRGAVTTLPAFPNGEMYKNMASHVHYTPEELGL
jgi:hypothetical protein